MAKEKRSKSGVLKAISVLKATNVKILVTDEYVSKCDQFAIGIIMKS